MPKIILQIIIVRMHIAHSTGSATTIQAQLPISVIRQAIPQGH